MSAFDIEGRLEGKKIIFEPMEGEPGSGSLFKG
jgi:hypothetical protein